MLKPVPLIVLTSIMLGIVSPFVVGLVELPDPDGGWSLARAWFFSIPTTVHGWFLPKPANMLVITMGLYVVQYLAVFAALRALARLVQSVTGLGATPTAFQSGRGPAFDKAVALYHARDYW